MAALEDTLDDAAIEREGEKFKQTLRTIAPMMVGALRSGHSSNVSMTYSTHLNARTADDDYDIVSHGKPNIQINLATGKARLGAKQMELVLE